MRRKIKNLIIRRVLPFACVLCLTGCGSTQNEVQENPTEEPIVIEEVIIDESEIAESEEGDEVEDSLSFYDAIDESGIFFGKVVEKEVTWDDIILTNEERGIETSPNSTFESSLTKTSKVYMKNLLSEEEQAVINRMNVRNLAQTAFLSDMVTDYVETHMNCSLYLEEEDDIDWDNLFTVLKTNLEQKQQECQEQIDNALDEETKEFHKMFMIEALSDEDLHNWVTELHAFVLIVREDIKNIDMRRLACVLEHYVVGYEQSTFFNFGAYAQTGRNQMIYPLWSGNYPNFAQFKQINFHEFYHLISISCPDEENELGELWAAGISLDSWLKYDEEFLKEHGIENQKRITYLPFNYCFIEEGLAEGYSCKVLGIDPMVYFDKQFTIDNLELSLFLQPNFKRGNLSRANLLHNPIAFIQQFPILDEANQQETEWLYLQLEMLECYNIINSPMNLVDFYWDALEENPDSLEEVIQTRIQILENYADLQLYRNFIWTLINAQNTERKDMTLEDYYYLFSLFEKRVEMQRKIVCINHNLESIDTENYLVAREEIKQVFFKFLATSQYDSQMSEVGEYKNYGFENGQLSGAFTEEEKRYLIGLYVEMNDYLRWVTEAQDSKDLEEKQKAYYIIP